jgi:beta-mannosidase
MPDLKTVRAFAGADEDLASPSLQNHERFIHGYDRMQMYLNDEFRPARDFASFVYLSQLMQAYAIKFGVEHMRSLQPETMGTLYWQLDDCWPVASWASIDYYGRWKALQYYAARFYAPLLIAAEPDGSTVKIHVVSDELQTRKAMLRVRLMKFDGTVLDEQSKPVTVVALASTPVEISALRSFDPKAAFLALTLEEGSHVLAANTVYFAKPREMELPEASIKTSVHAEGDGFAVELQSPVLARDVAFDFGQLEAKPDTQFFDLLPHESRRVHVASSASMARFTAALKVHSLVDAERQVQGRSSSIARPGIPQASPPQATFRDSHGTTARTPSASPDVPVKAELENRPRRDHAPQRRSSSPTALETSQASR